MVEDLILPGDVSSGEEAVEVVGGLTFSFAESFFANPFAVSFPGDLPCPGNLPIPQMPWSGTPCPSPGSGNPHVARTSTHLPTPQRSHKPVASPKPNTPPKSTINTPTVPYSGISKSTTKSTNSNSAYGHRIEFVDMADKKGAQRIRNTMNSRKHRQNKLDRIRELEKRLAELEAEKESWACETPRT